MPRINKNVTDLVEEVSDDVLNDAALMREFKHQIKGLRISVVPRCKTQIGEGHRTVLADLVRRIQLEADQV